MIKRLKQSSVLTIPIFLVVILFLALIVHQVNVRKDLAEDGWSRTAELLPNVSQHQPFAVEENSTYTVYIPNSDAQITHLTLDESLKVKSSEDFPVSIGPKTPFWASGNTVYYFEDKTIYEYDGSESSVFQEQVDGMEISGNRILYWKGKTIFEIDTKLGKSSKIGAASDKITNLFLSNSTSSFLAVFEEEITTKVMLYKESETESYKGQLLFEASEAGTERIIDVDFTQRDQLIDVIFTTYSTAQQQLTWRAYHNQFDLSDLETKQRFNELLIREQGSGTRIRKPNEIDLSLVDNKPAILFTAKGTLTPRVQTDNIYQAVLEDSKWIATRISTTKEISTKPSWVGEATVMWLDYTGKDPNLMAASEKPAAIKRLGGVTSEDWKQGFYSSLSSLGFGLIILIYAALWATPPYLILFIVTFFSEETMEERKAWVRYGIAGFCGIVQVALIQKFFTPLFAIVSPDYLSFSGASYVIPVVLLLLSWIITQFVKGEEWGVIQEFSYFIAINLLMIIMLIAPYVA
ncbi:hypothetical protein [Alkalihalobacillus sp. AL-G]|uniref:hypothetical protein n=1 Tax=Alkalihalobacillus sp. AL-G TaxID=2926399 RepID=UPI00272B7D2D|nr:hypothetical protein [Alkalihalobacillus sp. AL-G]WLD91539.1 hypothetical protein MOJ78_10815 [Alkalihalobacillus sp. AL-G]